MPRSTPASRNASPPGATSGAGATRSAASLPGGPAMNQADPDACRVQAARRDHEADAVQQGIRAGRQFRAVGVTVKNGEEPDERPRPPTSFGRASKTTTTPSTMADSAMPISMPGRCTPISPSIPPKAMTIGNVTGNSQTRGRPELRAPQPDGDHRQDVIQARHRMRQPAQKPGASPPARVGEGRRRARPATRQQQRASAPGDARSALRRSSAPPEAAWPSLNRPERAEANPPDSRAAPATHRGQRISSCAERRAPAAGPAARSRPGRSRRRR